jgi:hypothetical protein
MREAVSKLQITKFSLLHCTYSGREDLRACGHGSVDYRALFRRRELKSDQLNSILLNNHKI